jgi:hypothetical protein
MRAILLSPLIPLLAGCADLSTIVPTASAKFTSDRQLERTLTAQLVSELRNEDATLIFLSAGTYSCGDPKKVKNFVDAAQVKQKVKDENANLSKRLINALQTLDAYSKSLALIKQQDADAKKALAYLDKLIGIGAKIPGTPNYSALADAGLPLATGLADLASLEALRQLAGRMQAPLQNAVTVIKRNLTELTGDELNAYRQWDECAHETLVYLREVPINGVKKYSSFVGQSTGVELQSGYQAYLTKRAQFQSPDLNADLQAILDQNNNLMSGVYNNPDGLIAAIDNGVSFATKLQPVVSTKSAGH